MYPPGVWGSGGPGSRSAQKAVAHTSLPPQNGLGALWSPRKKRAELASEKNTHMVQRLFLSYLTFREKQPHTRTYLDHLKSADGSAFLEKGAFLLLAEFLVFLAAFFQIKFCAKNLSRKSAEFGEKSAEFRGSGFQHVGVSVLFRRFVLFLFCGRDFRRKVLPPEGPGMQKEDTDTHSETQTQTHKHRHTDRHTDTQTDRQTDGRTDRQTDRQTNIH